DSTLLSLHEVESDVYEVDGTLYQRRYFPYVESTKTETYEPEGSAQLILRREERFSDFDFATGNARTVTTTLTDRGSERWTSTTTTEFEPASWGCLALPHKITQTLTRVSPSRPSVTRTVEFTKDGSFCRHREQEVVAGNQNYKVTTT